VSLPILSKPVAVEPASAEALGHPIRGPRALDNSWTRFWQLAYNIARSEFKLKFFGSALGYVWQVMRPLLLFGVLYVFFVDIFHVDRAQGAAARFYGAQLLGSIVLFTFFTEAATGAVRSVVDRENLVRKIQFPRLAIPISIVLLALFNLALNLVVVMVFALISGVRPLLSWLELPLIVLMVTALATGVAMLLSALFVKFRDIQPIWEVLSQILFYSSPVIIPAETVRKKLLEEGGKLVNRGLTAGHVQPQLSAHLARVVVAGHARTRLVDAHLVNVVVGREPKKVYVHAGLDHFLYHLYTLNPLVTVFQQFRHAMINRGTYSAGQILGSWTALLEPLGLVAAIFVLGFWYFNREAPHIAEDL
jgi:ABC-2 type transport system permease protein